MGTASPLRSPDRRSRPASAPGQGEAKVIAIMFMSLDGYVADSNDGVSEERPVAVCREATQSTIAGRAFRRMVELHGRPLREIARMLPDPSWNHEA